MSRKPSLLKNTLHLCMAVLPSLLFAITLNLIYLALIEKFSFRDLVSWLLVPFCAIFLPSLPARSKLLAGELQNVVFEYYFIWICVMSAIGICSFVMFYFYSVLVEIAAFVAVSVMICVMIAQELIELRRR